MKSITNFFSFNNKSFKDQEIAYKLFLFRISSIILTVILIIPGIIELITESIFLGVFHIALSLLILINLIIFLNSTSKTNPGAYIQIILLAILCYFSVIIDKTQSGSYYWHLIFPIVSLMIISKKEGAIISLINLFILLPIISFPNITVYSLYTQPVELIFFTLCYLSLIVFMFVFELVRVNYLKKMEFDIREQIEEIKTKDDFISKLSHQIRTPLNNIMVITNLVNETKLDPNQKDLIDTIIASTNNLVNIVNNIVKVSNVEIKHIGVSNTTFDLSYIVNNILQIFREQKGNAVSFNLSCTESVKTKILGDPISIKQIFLNIFENLIKEEQLHQIQIDINIGTKEETTEAIKFQCKLISNVAITENPVDHKTFISPDNTEDKTPTTEIHAIDFTIADKIIKLYGGRLSVKPEIRSTIFEFTLQFKKAADAIKTTFKQVMEPVSSAEQFKPRKKIKLEESNVLLVEDNLINQKIVLLSLKKMVKNIDVANNGKEALDKFGLSKYDLVLMDVQMPVMDGIVATRKIRELEMSTNSQTPIIAITANALAGDKESCIAAGMNDYISKPFQVELLVQKMKHLIE